MLFLAGMRTAGDEQFLITREQEISKVVGVCLVDMRNGLVKFDVTGAHDTVCRRAQVRDALRIATRLHETGGHTGEHLRHERTDEPVPTV